MKEIGFLAPLLLSLAFLAACTSSDTPSNTPAAVPDALAAANETSSQSLFGEAEDFVLQTLAGDSLRLSDLRGQVVLLNFWATWCGPCIEEIPELIDLHNALNPHGFSVVGVSMDVEGAEVVKPFAERFGITYPLPLDTEATVADSYGGVFALPTTYVIDAEGQILQRVIGLFPVDQMRPELRAMLDLPPMNNTSN
ncbi:MAG: TlpA disulfide reductase family protein [Rhodothermales bacterium]